MVLQVAGKRTKHGGGLAENCTGARGKVGHVPWRAQEDGECDGDGVHVEGGAVSSELFAGGVEAAGWMVDDGQLQGPRARGCRQQGRGVAAGARLTAEGLGRVVAAAGRGGNGGASASVCCGLGAWKWKEEEGNGGGVGGLKRRRDGESLMAITPSMKAPAFPSP